MQVERKKEFTNGISGTILEKTAGVTAKGGRKEEKVKRGKKPGRKPSCTKVDHKMKLEKSRQSARECRARKKLRYQYLEELVTNREKAVLLLKKELQMYRQWARELDAGHIPDGLKKLAEQELKQESIVGDNSSSTNATSPIAQDDNH